MVNNNVSINLDDALFRGQDSTIASKFYYLDNGTVLKINRLNFIALSNEGSLSLFFPKEPKMVGSRQHTQSQYIQTQVSVKKEGKSTHDAIDLDDISETPAPMEIEPLSYNKNSEQGTKFSYYKDGTLLKIDIETFKKYLSKNPLEKKFLMFFPKEPTAGGKDQHKYNPPAPILNKNSLPEQAAVEPTPPAILSSIKEENSEGPEKELPPASYFSPTLVTPFSEEEETYSMGNGVEDQILKDGLLSFPSFYSQTSSTQVEVESAQAEKMVGDDLLASNFDPQLEQQPAPETPLPLIPTPRRPTPSIYPPLPPQARHFSHQTFEPCQPPSPHAYPFFTPYALLNPTNEHFPPSFSRSSYFSQYPSNYPFSPASTRPQLPSSPQAITSAPFLAETANQTLPVETTTTTTTTTTISPPQNQIPNENEGIEEDFPHDDQVHVTGRKRKRAKEKNIGQKRRASTRQKKAPSTQPTSQRAATRLKEASVRQRHEISKALPTFYNRKASQASLTQTTNTSQMAEDYNKALDALYEGVQSKLNGCCNKLLKGEPKTTIDLDLLFSISMELRDAEQYELAIKCLKKYISIAQTKKEIDTVHLRKARYICGAYLYDKGEFDEAVKFFIKNKDLHSTYFTADCFQTLGNSEEAIKYFLLVINHKTKKKNPYLADARNDLGLLFEAKEDFKQAKIFFKESNSGAAYANLGRIYEREDKQQQAMKFYALGMKQGDADCAYNLGIMKINEKKENPKKEQYSLDLRKYFKSGSTHFPQLAAYQMGKIYFYNEQYHKALEFFNKTKAAGGKQPKLDSRIDKAKSLSEAQKSTGEMSKRIEKTTRKSTRRKGDS